MGKKRTIAVIDFETDPFEYGVIPKPFACGILLEDGSYFFHWGDDVAKWAADFLSTRRLRVYAHNGGKFDYFFMLEFLDSKLLLINGRIAQATIGQSILYDSYLILPIPLSAMDKNEFDYNDMKEENRDKPEVRKRILEYLESDCVFLMKWVSSFVDRFGTKLTIAAAAFSELEKTGYPCKDKTYEKYDDVFRKYYMGGRTQCLETGFRPGVFKVIDINSAYPYAMMSPHPLGASFCVVENVPIKKLITMLRTVPMFFVSIIAVSYGCLPFKGDNRTESTMYPNDELEREYHTTSWEVKAGIDTNTLKIISVSRVLIHNHHKDFKSYVNKFFKEKTEGKKNKDAARTLFAKLMLNSAYGKFGADGRKYKENRIVNSGCTPYDDNEIDEIEAQGSSVKQRIEEDQWTLSHSLANGMCLWVRPDPSDDFYNVAVAASITGFIRAYLWRGIRGSVGAVYCDTDSIICKGFSGKIDPLELGAWDVEGVSVDDDKRNGIYIGGRKLYSMEIDVKIKKKSEEFDGRKIGDYKVKKAHKGARLTHEEIVSIVRDGKEVEWTNFAPSFSLSRPVTFTKRKITKTE